MRECLTYSPSLKLRVDDFFNVPDGPFPQIYENDITKARPRIFFFLKDEEKE